MSEHADSVTTEVLNTLTAEDAATGAGLYVLRGEYRVAQQLLGLACALEDIEARALTEELLRREIASVPMIGQTRDEQPRTPLRRVGGAAGTTITAWANGEDGDILDVSAFSDPPLQPGFDPIHVACKTRHAPGTDCTGTAATETLPVYEAASNDLESTQVMRPNGEQG